MDVIGIGVSNIYVIVYPALIIELQVFASYIMQCLLVFLLFLAAAIFFPQRPASAEANDSRTPSGGTTHRRKFLDLLLDSHKTQCYFSGTFMIASLSYGIFDSNMLVTFMILPLATNGILPVMFSYFLLVRHSELATGVTLLTLTC
jgi:hypothetical protein